MEENNIQMMAELRALDLEQCAEEAQKVYLRHMYAREASYMQIETTKKVMYTPEVLEMPEGEGYAASPWFHLGCGERKEPAGGPFCSQ